jgi:hypothetical protein
MPDRLRELPRAPPRLRERVLVCRHRRVNDTVNETEQLHVRSTERVHLQSRTYWYPLSVERKGTPHASLRMIERCSLDVRVISERRHASAFPVCRHLRVSNQVVCTHWLDPSGSQPDGIMNRSDRFR